MPLDTAHLRAEIQRVYSEVVRDPKKGYHFHTGPDYAAERLGYSRAELAELPDAVTGPFAGVGNPLAMGRPGPGEAVVDIGAGSGLDTSSRLTRRRSPGRRVPRDHPRGRVHRGRDHLAGQALHRGRQREKGREVPDGGREHPGPQALTPAAHAPRAGAGAARLAGRGDLCL